MSKAKKALWDSDCSSLLTAAGLSYQQRRGSEKRSQAAADLDDIFVALISWMKSTSCQRSFVKLLIWYCWYWNLSSHSVKIGVNDKKAKSQVATTMMESSFLVEAMVRGHITFTKTFSKFTAG